MTKLPKSIIIVFSNITKEEVETDGEVMIDKEHSIPDTKSISPLPILFKNLDLWPIIEFKCWNCDKYYKMKPRFIPIIINIDSYDSDTIIIKDMQTHGYFHSFACANAHIDACTCRSIINRKSRITQMRQNLLVVAYIFLSKNISTIPIAPNRYIKSEYCGINGKTQEEYDKLLDQMNDDRLK